MRYDRKGNVLVSSWPNRNAPTLFPYLRYCLAIILPPVSYVTSSAPVARESRPTLTLSKTFIHHCESIVVTRIPNVLLRFDRSICPRGHRVIPVSQKQVIERR